MAIFDIQDLTFTYPQSKAPALSGINLSIQAGEYVLLFGKSGCGKTTLLRNLKSVLAPFGELSGKIIFCGQELKDVDQREQASRIGFVLQNPDAQIVTDKVWHELAFGLESIGFDQSKMRLRVAEMASYFGISGWFRRDVSTLSGGQKQLLNLASVMAMQPDVLILDEPTSQLDPIAASDFLNTIRKINIELGTTIIITEHRLEDIYPAADRVVVLNKGCISAQGAPREVAWKLHEENSKMISALPAPARVFFAVEKEASDTACDDMARGGAVSDQSRNLQVSDYQVPDCPLTVREGRTWLSERIKEHPPKSIALPESSCLEPLSGGNQAIKMKDVWFRYSKDSSDVLCGVDIDIPQNQLFAIVGGNGAGKTTLLKCICGAIRPYRGRTWLLGKKISEWGNRELYNGVVAMLPQDPQNLFVKNTVRGDLEEMVSRSCISRSSGNAVSAVNAGQNTFEDLSRKEEAEQRIDQVVNICELENILDAHPYDLSGGEQQRAALAKVLLTNPRILLLDEPTKGLDSFFKQKLANVLKELCDQGISVVMVSHDVEFCARYADVVSMFFDGSIVATNTPRRFFSSNSFYTTAANRMSRSVFENAVTDEDVVELCLD